MGGGSEKLLTLEEAARRLDRSADDLEGLIRRGDLPAFRLGGKLLRIRARDVEILAKRLGLQAPLDSSGHPPTGQAPGASPARSRLRNRIRDFFYFNNFYLVALLILLTLLAIILNL